MSYNVVVVGATGNVGSTTLKILSERNFPIKTIEAVASRKSLGKEVSFGEERILKVKAIDDYDFRGMDIAFFSAGSSVSREYATKAAKQGCIVIDKTSFFRMDKDIPLVVPEVNPEDLAHYKDRNIIANPNCVALPLTVSVNPIHEEFGIKKIIMSSFQSVSGAGKAAMDELYNNTKNIYSYKKSISEKFSRQISFNVIPQIGNFLENHFTDEEDKIQNEVRKIIDSSISVTATCVRVPVFIGHSESVYLECEDDIDMDILKNKLNKSEGIIYSDFKDQNAFITPIEVVGTDKVYISRVRAIAGNKKAITMWIAADNLRKGAALNAVQIAELLIKEYI